MHRYIGVFLLVLALGVGQACTMQEEEKKTKETASQVKKTDSDKPEKETAERSSRSESERKDPVVGKTGEGKSVYEGSRNGHYYLNDKGDKVYVKDFVGARVVGHTKNGRPIYEGPRGGRYYYTASGNKEYISKVAGGRRR